MTQARQNTGDAAPQIACAFSEAFFGFRDTDGRTMVPLDQAQVFASGRMDLWADWETQSAEVHRLVGRFLRLRHNDLGSPRRFLDAAHRLGQDPDSPYAAPEDVPSRDVTHLLARHGQDPLDLAQRLLDEAEAKYRQARKPLPVATQGRWSFGWKGQSVVDLPETIADNAVSPVVLNTTPQLDSIKITKSDLLSLATELADGSQKSLWQHQIIQELFEALKDIHDLPISELLLNAGRLRLLNAPTGVGKSVLTRLLAIYLARQGIPVAIVVGNINESLATAERIQAEEANARVAAEEIRQDLGALNMPYRCTALVSPQRLHEKAAQAAGRGEWQRFDQLGYGCVMPTLLVDGPPPAESEEPCTTLHEHRSDDDSDGQRQARGAAQSKRHACPWLTACGKHRGFHEAAAAEIVVTNHHNLVHGTVPVPVRVDGVDYGRLTVLEFLMRRCAVLVVDEIDLFQSNMFDAGARQLVLSANGGTHELPLAQMDAQRSMLLPVEDRDVVPALSRTRFLADQFLNYVLEGDLWLDADPHRPSSGWHVPGSNNRMLLEALLGIDTEAKDVPRDVYEQFDALFPDTRDDHGGTPPPQLRKIANLLSSVVSNDTGQDRIREVKHELHQALARRVPDAMRRRDVVNALLVRTWLGSLHQSLTRLTYAVGSSGSDLPAARILAEKLGTFVQHAAIPHGPLGYLLFGFRVDKTRDPDPRGRLSVQAIAGDPHTTTVQLGSAVALAAAGLPRIVLGLSATGFFPKAAREHINTEPTYAMTDADPGAVTTQAGKALDEQFQPVSIAGIPESQKPEAIRELGRLLWEQKLDAHLSRLVETDPDRERCLLVGNSYTHAALLGAGIAAQAGDPSWVAVVVPKDDRPSSVALPSGVVRVTVDDLEDLPRRHPHVKVCTAPLSQVARGLNILVPGSQRSALASIWVCVRPVTQLNDPAEMFASINSHALGIGVPGPNPAAVLSGQRRAAYARLFTLLASDPRFSRLKRELKAEVVAGMLVELIQLAGRARRGGTKVELYLVDNAFHDPKLGSDLPSLLRFYHDTLTPEHQHALRRIYGSTLMSWLDFAGIPHPHNTHEDHE